MSYLICLIIFLQVFTFRLHVAAAKGGEGKVAFYCGRPSKVLINDAWRLDFNQNCLTNEKDIVEYCKRSFPTLKIQTAEPDTEKVKFQNWCDFNSDNCQVDAEIRPFKCLDKTFQSDALVLPRNCKFGHLVNQTSCLNYKSWMEMAENQCNSKSNWYIKSFGMLFACGDNSKSVKPMHFKGVEFVCCPRFDNSETEDSDISIYKTYLNNAVLETEKKEQEFYNEAEKRLSTVEKEKKSEVIDQFKDSENSLTNLWVNDPKNAKEKERKLISKFKKSFKAVQKQFVENKEQLLKFHDERLQFIFDTTLAAAQTNLNAMLGKPGKSEVEIYESMKNVLIVLSKRKKYLMLELNKARGMYQQLEIQIYKKISFVNKLSSDIFRLLDKVPEFKDSIRKKLVKYFNSIDQENISDTEDSTRKENDQETLKKIINMYIHREDLGAVVHHDLGTDDPDQYGHYAKKENTFFDEKILQMTKHGIDVKTVYGLIGGFVVLVIFIVVSILVLSRLKRHSRRNPNQKSVYLAGGNHKQLAFGVEKEYNNVDSLDRNKIHGLENPSYVVTNQLISSRLDQIPLIKENRLEEDNNS